MLTYERTEGAGGPALALEGVVRRYGDHVALDGVDLAIGAGEVLALLGPNGAGKSTLVGLAAGLRRPDAGTVRVLGADPAAGDGVAGRVGLAPQDIGVYPALTVRENLRAFGELSGLRPRAARARAEELLGPFRLDGLADRSAGKLSGGEQRRLHTAIALVARPRLVLLDEPTAGADVETRSAILDVVRGLAADGTAVLYTTHYLGEVEELDAGVALLEAGRIVVTGTVGGLIEAHGTAVLLLAFDGPPPDLRDVAPTASVDGDSVTITCPDPGVALTAVVAGLGPAAERLVGVEVVRPSLEAAYRQLTGRRHAEDDAT